MFYRPWVQHQCIFLSKNVLSKKTLRLKKIYQNSLYSLLYQTSNVNAVFIFRKSLEKKIFIPLPLASRFSKIASINIIKSRVVVSKIVADLIYNFSFNTLYYFFKKLFWIIPVPKHKQLLYLLRAICKFAFRLTNNWTGLSVTLRGKLAATGNKRTTSFKCLLGDGSASNILGLNQTDFRNIVTTTGIIGITSIITYIR